MPSTTTQTGHEKIPCPLCGPSSDRLSFWAKYKVSSSGIVRKRKDSKPVWKMREEPFPEEWEIAPDSGHPEFGTEAEFYYKGKHMHGLLMGVQSPGPTLGDIVCWVRCKNVDYCVQKWRVAFVYDSKSQASEE